MKKKILLLTAVLLAGTVIRVAAQDAATAFKRANQQFVLFESERDKGANLTAAYNYLLESYNAFMEVMNSGNSQDYTTGMKNRLRSMYPYMLNAMLFYSEQQSDKALDFALAYIDIPKMLIFRDELMPRDNRYPSIVYYAATASYNQQKYSQALRLFEEYLSTGTETQEKECYVFMNLIYMAQKDYANQEAVLEKAIGKYPVSLDFLYNLVNVHIATNNMEKLLGTIDRILAIDPNNEQVLPIKARLLERAGKYMEAREIFERLHTLYPNNLELTTGLARVNFNIATEIVNSGLTVTNDAEYALIRQRASNYIMEAQDLFQEILKKEPTAQKYMMGLAGVYDFMGMKNESAVLKKIIEDGASYETFPTRLQAYKEALKQNESTAPQNGTAPPVPVNPPLLVIRVDSFIDSDQNRVIDAGESFALMFTIENQGKGDAYDLRIRLSEQQGFDQYFDGPRELDGGSILAGESRQYTFRYIARKDLPNALAHINIYAFEANGFDAHPSELVVNLQESAMPRLEVADHYFAASQGTSIRRGENARLTLSVRNMGAETAHNVKLNFKLPANIFATDNSEIVIDSIAPGKSVSLDYGFVVNNRFEGDSIAVMLTGTESSRSSFLNEAYKVKLGEYLAQTNIVAIEGQLRQQINPDNEVKGLDTELLDGVPVGTAHPHRYALIIGNEDYSTMTGNNSEINVPYAVADALVFREYCLRTFGIPYKQIRFVPNATAGMMRENLDWLVNMASVDPEAELFFYYSGHGNNDESSKKPFLLPVDITGSNIDLGLSLDYLYKELATYPIEGAYVFLDACFSGGYKSEAPFSARKGVRVVPKSGLPQGRTLSFSSSSGDQTSGVYHEKKQGYYTYFLLKTLKDADGNLTLKELFDRTTESVKRATAMTDKLQEPQYMVSPEWSQTNAWQDIVLKTSETAPAGTDAQP